MKKHLLSILFLLGITTTSFTQIIPSDRTTDWSIAGLQTQPTQWASTVNLSQFGAIGDGVAINDTCIQQAIAALGGQSGIIEVPAGNFLFTSTINLPDSILLKGSGAASTTLTFDLGGSGHCILVAGTNGSANDTTSLILSASKNDMTIEVDDPSIFQVGDWFRTIQDDADLATSTWGVGTIGQIIKITAINGNELTLASPLRMDYELTRTPYIRKINMREQVGIECLKIHRLDATTAQTSNIRFIYAANSWVNGIESQDCNFAHIEGRICSNIDIRKSYMHHGFDYGGGGKAYGVMLHITANECRVEDNLFEHLRHSMIVQAGANGNVFAYNYSFDPYWDEFPFPSNSAGDAVLHGNYPYLNLFEGNIVQNIVIDNSHGPNGPHNTFFRNRAENAGVFFSANNSPDQNIVATDITGNDGLYFLQGSGHFLYGNNYQNAINPAGTDSLPDLTYLYNTKPSWIPYAMYGSLGTPNPVGGGNIPARYRYDNGNFFINSCGNFATPQISFRTGMISSGEGMSAVELYVDIMDVRPDSASTVTLDLNTMSDATENDDYYFAGIIPTILPTTLTFNAGDDTPKMFLIEIVDDNIVEPTEYVHLLLTNPTEATLGQDSLVIEIADNDMVSTTAIENQSVNIYPNPVQDVLTIATEETADLIQISDINGRIVYQNAMITNNLHQIETSNWQTGVYFVLVQQGDKYLVSKVVVE